MKRVLYIGGFELPDKNAAAQRVMANAKLLREIGFEVSFIGISKDINNAPEIVDGFQSEPIPYPSSIKQWIRQICIFIDTKVILSHKPDYVILYNFPSIASLRILRTCHQNGIKVIEDITEWEAATSFSLREIIHWFDINLRMRFAVKEMDGVIAISRLLHDYYHKYTSTIMVPPTVDISLEKWNRNRKLTVNSPRKLIYAGSIGMGNKDRLDKIIDVVQKYKSLELDIIGLDEQQYLSAFGQESPLSNNVHFFGRVSHVNAVTAVQKADFQLLIRDSTLKNNAGFPTKFVESMTCCTPLIATSISNITDYLQNGINGFLVDENQTLNTVLGQIIEMRDEEIIEMKTKCKDLVCFDFRNYKSDFERLFC